MPSRRRPFADLDANQARLRRKSTFKGDRKRKVIECPVCLKRHKLGDSFDSCWVKISKADITAQTEFASYLKKNKLGIFRV